MEKIILYILIIFIGQNREAIAQDSVYGRDASNFHYGVAAKVNIEFNFRQNAEKSKTPNFKLSLTGALGYNFENALSFPTIHTGIIIFNRGPIGSNLSNKWTKLQSHFFYSLLYTLKLDKRTYDYTERYVPFYHFADFTSNPLQNPYKSSLSYGAIWIHLSNKLVQRVGLFNSNIAGRFQFTYYNDGGPLLSFAGDNFDRYYTGGLLFSYNGNLNDAINSVDLSFHKHTGYTPYGFDIGDRLQLDFLVYADEEEFVYNQQRWRLDISSLKSGFGGNISLYNYNRLDVQDFIHFRTNVPYHPDYYKASRVMFGGKYVNSQLKLSN